MSSSIFCLHFLLDSEIRILQKKLEMGESVVDNVEEPYDFGGNFMVIPPSDQIRELQTIIRDVVGEVQHV